MPEASRHNSSPSTSPWRPLRIALFRNLLIADLVSDIGAFMQTVGAAWLMTSLTSSPAFIALIQTASALPFFLLALPAGSIGDIFDRRKLILSTEIWMFTIAAVLAVVTFFGWMTPWLLLLLTVALSLGDAIESPTWRSIFPELVETEDLTPALALNGIEFNLARATGPGLGGLIVAVAGVAATFLLDALSFLGVIFVIFKWKRSARKSNLPAETLTGASLAAIRYVRYSPGIRVLRVRSGPVIFFGCSFWALLPPVAKTLSKSPLGYGFLLGFFGVGAVLGAVILQRVVEPSYPLASNATVDAERDDDEIGVVRKEDWRSTKATNNLRVTPAHLRGLDWNSSGWIEGLAGHLLNEREKKSADFLCGGHLGLWSSLWRLGLKVAAIGVVALLLPQLFAPWIGIAIGAVASPFALPVTGGRLEGMQLVRLSGTVRPACAGIPLSYTEMSRVLAKINLLRYAAWLPIFIVYGGMLAWRLHMAPLLGLKVAAEILLVLISIQPILIVGHHSYGTNDTKRLNLHSIVAILVIGSIGIAYAVCLTIVFIATEWAPEGSRAVPVVAAVTGMFFCSSLIWFCYKLFYNRGHLDTMRVADSQQPSQKPNCHLVIYRLQ